MLSGCVATLARSYELAHSRAKLRSASSELGCKTPRLSSSRRCETLRLRVTASLQHHTTHFGAMAPDEDGRSCRPPRDPSLGVDDFVPLSAPAVVHTRGLRASRHDGRGPQASAAVAFRRLPTPVASLLRFQRLHNFPLACRNTRARGDDENPEIVRNDEMAGDGSLLLIAKSCLSIAVAV